MMRLLRVAALAMVAVLTVSASTLADDVPIRLSAEQTDSGGCWTGGDGGGPIVPFTEGPGCNCLEPGQVCVNFYVKSKRFPACEPEVQPPNWALYKRVRGTDILVDDGYFVRWAVGDTCGYAWPPTLLLYPCDPAEPKHRFVLYEGMLPDTNHPDEPFTIVGKSNVVEACK